jgi:hypothetical protein
LLGADTPGGLACQHRADINAVAATDAPLESRQFGDILEGMGMTKTAGQESAPSDRRLLGVEHEVQHMLNPLDIGLDW